MQIGSAGYSVSTSVSICFQKHVGGLAYEIAPWLTVYGGFAEAFRSSRRAACATVSRFTAATLTTTSPSSTAPYRPSLLRQYRQHASPGPRRRASAHHRPLARLYQLFLHRRHVPEHVRRSLRQQPRRRSQRQHHRASRQPTAKHPGPSAESGGHLQGDRQLDARRAGHRIRGCANHLLGSAPRHQSARI